MTFRPHVYVQTDVPPGVSLRAWRREQPPGLRSLPRRQLARLLASLCSADRRA